MKFCIPLLALLFTISVPVAQGHHSIAGAYDSKSQITVDGAITEFRFVNPHPFIVVEVKNNSGAMELWKLEMDNRSELSRIGMDADTLKVGDRIVVVGQLAKAQPQALYIRRLDRPADGFRYEQAGSSPKINFKP